MDRMQASLIEFLGQWDSPPLLRPLIRLVAKGEPVPVEQLAAEAGLPVEEVESLLGAQPGVDWDVQGRVLGFGLTQRPTAHRFVVDGRVLYTFCAADTLIFPVLLDQLATVQSRCATTGREIRIEVNPQAVTSADPATTVVSQVSLCSDCVCSEIDIRATVCDHGHFFATAEAAAQWRREHPDGEVRPVGEYFTRFRVTSRELEWAG